MDVFACFEGYCVAQLGAAGGSTGSDLDLEFNCSDPSTAMDLNSETMEDVGGCGAVGRGFDFAFCHF